MKKTLLIITALLVTLISQAGTIIVDNINDTGTGSLRQAATDAASGDTIRFNPSLLTSAVDSISLSTEINFGAKGIVIKGLYSATDTLFISGGNSSRIFSFNGAGKVVLDSLVLINGNGVGATYNGSGGALAYLQATDTLHISNSIIKGNTAENGGGVYSDNFSASSIVDITNSTISGNTAIDYGGGIYSNGSDIFPSTVNISKSTISGNTAANGGGIYSVSLAASSLNISSSNSTVSISNSTIVGNTASIDGAGVYSAATNASTVNISMSTINGNTASNDGGGIYSNAGSPAGSNVTILRSTINGNTAYAGGGVYSSFNFSSGDITVNNSTFSGNLATGGGGIYSSYGGNTSVNIGSSIFDGSSIFVSAVNVITSQGYNIFTDAPSGVQNTDNSNVSSASINLQPLAFNGGTTKTMLPGPNSIAIDMGNPADMSDAQNDTVIAGIRDVGAAERNCQQTISSYSVTANSCTGYTLPSGNSTYTTLGTYTVNDTIENALSCDSVMTITITVIPVDHTVTASNSSVLVPNTGTTINTATSLAGFNYYLRDNANDTIVSGPLAGTGSGLSFNTGAITSDMTYNVYADQLKETAVSFDQSTSEMISVPNNNDFEFQEGTIEAWLKPEYNSNENRAFISLRNGNGPNSTRWSLHMNTSDNSFGMYNGNIFQPVTVQTALNQSQWYHVALVINSDSVIVFVDGVNQGVINSGMSTGPTGMNLTIGNNGDPAFLEGFIGAMDDVRIWNTARSITEINNFKDECLEGTESGLVALYSFEDGTAKDLTGNGHDGTVTGINLVNDTVTSPQKCLTCGTEMSNTVSVTISSVSLEEQADEMNLSLFPNPATSTLTIENGGMNIKAISILDVTGKTLETLMGNTSTIDVSLLNKGIYFLQIHTDKGLISKKFIKK